MKRNHFQWTALGAALTAGVLFLSLNLTAQPRPSASPTVLALASPTPSATPAAYVSPSPVPLLPSPPATQPKITWSPTSSIEVILSPNDTTTKDFTFRSDQPLQNVVLEPVPALAPFLNVQPNSFTSVPAGQPQAVRVNFVIPAAATLGTYDGTIHLRRGSQTLPQTLKVVVNVWRAFQEDQLHFSLKLPPHWNGVIAAVGSGLEVNSVLFRMPLKTPVQLDNGTIETYETKFIIDRFAKEAWKRTQRVDEPHATFLAETDAFVYGYWTAQDSQDSPTTPGETFLIDVPNIVRTFMAF